MASLLRSTPQSKRKNVGPSVILEYCWRSRLPDELAIATFRNFPPVTCRAYRATMRPSKGARREHPRLSTSQFTLDYRTHQPPDSRNLPLPPSARPQSGGLVSVGTGSV